MRAAVLKNKGQLLQIEQIDRPEPAPGQVLIKVEACGVCGSDVHASEAEWTPLNIVMGHEYSGTVATLGEGVGRWKVGQRVAPVSQISCGQCPKCHSGDFHHCENLVYTDYSTEFNGAYAEFCLTGENDILPLADNISFEEAATIEPLAVGYDAVRRARLKPGESVLIVGAGPIGLTTAAWARFFGARHVVVSERNPERLALADLMGATHTINAGEEPDVMAVCEKMTGVKPLVIFECVGIPGMIQQMISMAEPRSKIIVVGVCMEPDTFIPMDCTFKALELVFPFGYSISDYEYIFEQMEMGRISGKPLISNCISLEELPDMFERLKKPTDQCKVIVMPNNHRSSGHTGLEEK